MSDREKVISGLEHCGFTEKRGCDGCPYEDECINFGNDAGHGSICTDALALLREQKPVMPKDLNGTSVFRSACGNCGMPLYAHDFRFCPYCGRGVKWDD